MEARNFLTLTHALPEPTLLLSGDGRVLAANPAAVDLLGTSLGDLQNRLLAESVSDPPEDVAHYLALCVRSRSMVLGALSMRGKNGADVPCRAEGCLLEPAVGDAEPTMLLRLTAKESAIGQFVALNQRIEDLNREVRRRQLAEAAVREETDRLRVTLNSIGDAVIVTDADGRVELMNPVAESLTGFRQADALGRPLDEVFHVVNETTREPVANPALRALREGVIVGLANHSVLIARDGRECAIDDSAAPVRDGSGAIVGSVLVFRDITTRRAAESALVDSESRLRQLADAMPQIVWTTDAAGRIDYLNRRWTEFTGLPQTSGNSAWSALLHPEDAAEARRLWAASLERREPFEMAIRLLARDGAYRWHLLRTVEVTDESGQVRRWFGTATDIDQQKRSEESARYLAAASASLASVVDPRSTLQKVANLAVPYFADWAAVDVVTDGRLERLAVAHRDAARVELVLRWMEEYPPNPDAPHGVTAVLRTGRPELLEEIPDELLERSAVDARHLELLRSLGLRSYIAVPLLDATRVAFGVLTFVMAESGRRYHDADLRLAMDLAHRAAIAVENAKLYQALRDSDRRKDEFLAMLAHELRNPLAPISNSLQILTMPEIDATTAERAKATMTRQVRHLVRLVDDLLDVSRAVVGKIELRREPVDVGTVLNQTVETLQPLLQAHGHRLTIEHLTAPLVVDADAVRLTQVVSNLLTNAIKYTPRDGHIRLSAERHGHAAVIRVADNGIGIHPEMRDRIFDIFVQGDNSGVTEQGGLGIGLTLVRTLVLAHQGTIQARSDGPGLGSEFEVRLPLSASVLGESPEMRADRPEGTPASSGHRVLVVDDNQDAAESLATLLRLQGHDVRVEHSGEAALAAVQTYAPDAVFLDIGMPGLDGYEVARRLRTERATDGMILAAVTGWGQHADRRRSLEAGFNHHIVKPPDPGELERVFVDLKRRVEGPAPHQKRSPSES